MLRRFRIASGGNIATLSALLAPVLIAGAALTVDQASLYTERRNVQRVVDLAAIAAASSIDNAPAAALAVLRDNGYRDVQLVVSRPRQGPELDVFPQTGWVTVTTGRYSADRTLAPPDRFVPGATRPTAVKVQFGRKGTRYFASALLGEPWMSASGTAAAEAKAAFSVGSRLAALDGGIANALLGTLTGSSLSLSVMDYNALLAADVDLLHFLDALATDLDITAGTYEDLLDTRASVGQIAKALASVSRAGSREKAALATIATAAAPALKLTLASIIDLGPLAGLAIGQHSAAASLTAGLGEILTASAAVANGDRQLALNLGAQVPGRAGRTLRLAIGERPQSSPWLTVSQTGAVVRTAQTRLMLRAKVGGAGVLAGIAVNIPIYIELATAEATLQSVSCPPQARVTVGVKPGIAEVRIAEVTDSHLANFGSTPSFGNADIVDATLIKASGKARVRIGNMNSTPLTFSASDIANAAVKSASTTGIVGSLTQSLANDLDLTVKIVGIDLGLSALVRTAVTVALSGAAPVLDAVVANLLQVLGVRLGEADVRVHGLVCQRPVLVQ